MSEVNREGMPAGTQATDVVDAGTGTEKGVHITATEVPAMPEGGFEKFYNAKDGSYNWENHAKELAFKLEQKGKAEATPDAASEAEAGEATGGTETSVSLEEATKEIEALGFSEQDLVNELVENEGKLSDATVAALVEKTNFTEESIRSFGEFKFNEAKDFVTKVETALGDIEAVRKHFAQPGMETKRIAFTKLLNDPETWEEGVAMVRAEMGAIPRPQSGKQFTGGNQAGNTGASEVKPFASQAEFNAAFMDPKYKTDPNFRAEVEARVRATDMTYSPRLHTSGR